MVRCPKCAQALNTPGEAVSHACAFGRNEQTRTRRTTYPSFYGAVHDAWNRLAASWKVDVEVLGIDPATGEDVSQIVGGAMPTCEGLREPYEPDEHPFCYSLAGLLRVELHAAGIALSIDPPVIRPDDTGSFDVRAAAARLLDDNAPI